MVSLRSIKSKMIAYSLFIVFFSTVSAIVGSSFINYRQIRNQNRLRIENALKAFETSVNKAITDAHDSLGLYTNNKINSTQVAAEIYRISADLDPRENYLIDNLLNLAKNSKASSFAFYFPSAFGGKDIWQYTYASELSKNGVFNQFNKSRVVLYTLEDFSSGGVYDDAERPSIYPLELRGGNEVSLERKGDRETLLVVQHEFRSLEDNALVKSGDHLGTFIMKRDLEKIWSQFDTETGVNFNVFNLDRVYEGGQQRIERIEDEQLRASQSGIAVIQDRDGNLYDSIVRPIIWKDRTIAYVAASISQDQTFKRIAEMALLLVLVGLLVLAVMTAITWYLSRDTVAPILSIVNASREIVAGNLDSPLTATGNDEIGLLARNFVSMRDSIKEKFFELKKLTESGENIGRDYTRQNLAKSIFLAIDAFVPVKSCLLFTAGETDGLRTYRRSGVWQALEAAEKARTELSPAMIDQLAAVGGRGRPLVRSELELCSSIFGETGQVLVLPLHDVDATESIGFVFLLKKGDGDDFADLDVEYLKTLQRIASISLKNIHMIDLIADQNDKLEIKVKQRTAELSEKNQLIGSMLQSLQQSLLTFSENLLIEPGYSKDICKVFATEDVAERNAIDFLLEKTSLDPSAKSEIASAVATMFGSSTLAYDANCHLLPRRIEITVNEQRKALEVDWDPIRGESGDMARIMVVMRDVTEMEALKQEREQNNRTLQMVDQILTAGFHPFYQFQQNTRHLLNDCRRELASASSEEQKINLLFRNMHTIKGNAKVYHVSGLITHVHGVEQYYSEVRAGQHAWDYEQVLAGIVKVEAILQDYVWVLENRLKFTKQAQTEAGSDLELLPLRSLLEPEIKSLKDLAADLGKEAPQIHINDRGFLFRSSSASLLKNILTHCLRNSMDHGLETADERRQQGKNPQGKIDLEIRASGTEIELIYRDDGRGLNLPALHKLLLKRQNLEREPTRHEIAETIFSAGTSTAQARTDISGCGEGMNAVRSFLREQGGDAAIVLDEGKDTFCSFHFVFTFPSKIAYQPPSEEFELKAG